MLSCKYWTWLTVLDWTLTLTDWIEWNGDWSYDYKAQNLLLKDVFHWKSSAAEQLASSSMVAVRIILSIQLCSYPSGLILMLLSVH
ncbi:hypothetical protein MHYP_G00296860 [Metynnis hypsauchen]